MKQRSQNSQGTRIIGKRTCYIIYEDTAISTAIKTLILLQELENQEK